MNTNNIFRHIKWMFLWVISCIGWIIAIPFVPAHIIYRLFSKKYDHAYYFRRLAVGNDIMVGAMIYGSRHTISAITGKKSLEGSLWHKYQEKIINAFFGKDHCKLEYEDEFKNQDK